MSQIPKSPCEDAVILTGTAGMPCAKSARRWTLIAAILGSSLTFLDGTIVNVALPSIQKSLGASASDIQWVMESYALFLASLLLAGGALGDRLGRKRVFFIGIIVFTLTSIGCSLSASAQHLISMRAMQGIGAALVVPGSLALISATFPPSERGAAIGTWSAFSGIAAAIGPVVGGFIIEHFSWHWAFLMNVPFGVALCIICATKVPESRGDTNARSVDVSGTLLVTIGLAGVVYALIEAPARGWSAMTIWGAAAAGVFALAAFIVVETKVSSPLLPLKLFKSSDFAGANVLTLLLYAALGGSFFFLPLNLIQVQGYGATVAGATFLPFIAIMFLMSRWAGSLVDRFGSRLPLTIGPTIASAGFVMLALPAIASNYWIAFFPAICVLGLGMSITVAPLTTTVMNSVGKELAGTASGVNNAVSRTGGLLAIALFGLLLTMVFDAALASRLSHANLPSDLVASVLDQRQKLAGIEISAHYSNTIVGQARHAIDMAFVTGFRCVMLTSAGLALLSAISARMLIGRKR
jgi:EmrB/QacA subfamily drug resistance transporter